MNITYENEEKTKGTYYYPNGNVYKGDFKNGKFHGKGILIFKDKGKYEGIWKDGKMIEGKYIFNDGLIYDNHWDYLSSTPFYYNEKINHNEIVFTEEKKNMYLEKVYDAGDGYCKTEEKTVYDFINGYEIRKINTRETNWIEKHCATYS